MCGIAGIVRLDGGIPEERQLRAMSAALAHRGPDGDGVLIDGAFGLAHRRLAIINPEGSRQPLVDPQSGLALIYNGEVYNYRELHRDLDAGRGEGVGDTEAVLLAWRKWGPASLDRLRGMFAFALADRHAGRLHLVRDRLGIKPLYYARRRDRVVFASELGALLAGLDQPPAIDRQALSLYLRYGYVPSPRTIWHGIAKLPPGSRLEIDVCSGRAELSRWWRPCLRPQPRGEAAAIEELAALLTEIAELYLRSDVPFGAFLSGGVDSSLVTALMAARLGTVRTYSIGFDDPQYNELPYAAAAARHLGATHRMAEMMPSAALPLLARLAARFGEPFADASCLPTWFVAQLAAADVKMVLSGDGGDELFAGYASYGAVFDEVYGAGDRVRGLRRLAARLRGAPKDWRAIHHRQRDAFDARQRERLLADGAVIADDEPDAFPDAAGADPVLRCQARDLETYLVDDILTKVDRMSMDNSLEVRVPLLDHKLVEFAFALPLELRARRIGDAIVGKYLLKRVAEWYLPRDLVERPKWGFGIPIEAWLAGALRPLVTQLLDDEATHLAALVDPAAVRAIVRDHYSGRRPRSGQVWNLLALRLWLDSTIGSAAAARSQAA